MLRGCATSDSVRDGMNDAKHGPPPNNPTKLPSLVLGIGLELALIVVGVVNGPWWLILIGVIGVLLTSLRLRAVHQGRNPRWTRAPRDYLWRRDRDP
jgi:hypothetical protein